MYEDALQRWETSVCRKVLCSPERLLELARTRRADAPAKALADVAVSVANENGLTCVEAPVDGFPEHAVLLGWPNEREQQMLLAIALTKASTRTVVPPV